MGCAGLNNRRGGPVRPLGGSAVGWDVPAGASGGPWARGRASARGWPCSSWHSRKSLNCSRVRRYSETFVEALDGIFTAAGPLIGVLLEGLTPILLALTPAIEPLARALAPLIELFGAGLLIVIQAITPAIILFANGLEKVTSFIRDTVLKVFRFIVDQLNKLPFIDVQVELDRTGDSFDTMAGQIANAGNASDMAAGKAGTLESQTRATAEATARLARLEADLERRREANVAVTQRLADETAELGRRNLRNAKAAQILAAQMSELGRGIDDVGYTIGVVTPPITALDQAIADMTMQITEAQTAADLNAAAFAALSPELMAAAEALGLFGSQVAGVGSAAGGGGGGRRGLAGGTGYDAVSGRVDLPNGTSYYGVNPFAVGATASEVQASYNASIRPTVVNVQVGDETVDAVTETFDHRREITGRGPGAGR